MTWERTRSLFPVTREVVYFNNAGVAPISSRVDEAIRRWTESGQIDDAQVIALQGVEFVIADLSPGVLAQSTTDTIYIDDDAAGFGWFVDPTPSDDIEFDDPAFSGDSSDRMDLLSAVMHEMGHIIGFDHQDEGVLEDALLPGERLQITHDHHDQYEHYGLSAEIGKSERFAGPSLLAAFSGGKEPGFEVRSSVADSEYDAYIVDVAPGKHAVHDYRQTHSVPLTGRLHLVDWLREFLR